MGSAAATLASAGASYLASKSQADAADDRYAAADAYTRQRARIAGERWDRYKEIFAPLEEKYVKEAEVTPSEEQEYIDEAGKAVTQAFGNKREQAERRLSRYGLDPTSGRYQGIQRDMDMREAAEFAGARNEERRRMDDLKFQRMGSAVGLGKGLPQQAARGYAGAAQGMRQSADRYAQAAGQTASFVSGLPWKKVGSEVAGWFNGGGG